MPAPERLETDRLCLVRPDGPLNQRIAGLYREPQVMRYIVEGGRTAEQAAGAVERMEAQWREHGFGAWAVLLRAPAAEPFVGMALLKREPSGEVELGYALAQPHWGRGYATEAARALVGVAFGALALPHLAATVESGNEVSSRVLRKLGFRFVSVRPIPGDKRVEVWRLSREDARAQRSD